MRYSFGSFAALLVTVWGSGNPLLGAELGGQTPDRQPTNREWTITRDPFADLWFHSLAVIGYDGYGPLSLYDARYASRVRDTKARAHMATMLDRRAPDLRRSLAADSAFEVLHFLPLYFVGQEPSLVLSALRAAARETSRGQAPGALTFAPNAVVASLPTRQERDVLVSLLDAVADEWATFVRADRAAHETDDRRVVRELQSAWDDRFAHVLDGYLAAMRIGRGTILVSPAIGNEGRIIRDPSGAAIIVVSSERGVVGDNDALLRSVRELAFPLLNQLRTPLTTSTSRIDAEQARDAAAVRAGAIILDAVDEALAADYRRLFLDAIGGRSFDTAFPLNNEAKMELRRLVISAAAGAAPGRTSYEN
jgi:hypothetical protein